MGPRPPDGPGSSTGSGAAPSGARSFRRESRAPDGLGCAPLERRPRGGAIPPEAFILVDTVGELAGLYEAADVSFVGGSLVPAGGHNLLEPAGAGSPILVGPHTENFREISDLLIAAGAARVIGSDGLAAALEELLQDETKRRAMGEAGRGVVERNAGATARTIDLLGELIGEPA